MDATVPDYIFASGISAQQARSKRSSSIRPTSPRASIPENSQDIEIKSVIGHLQGVHRAWPQQMHFDMPRLVRPNEKSMLCDESHVNDYIDYLIELFSKGRQKVTAHSLNLAINIRLLQLWAVWGIPGASYEKRKLLVEPFLVKARVYAKERILALNPDKANAWCSRELQLTAESQNSVMPVTPDAPESTTTDTTSNNRIIAIASSKGTYRPFISGFLQQAATAPAATLESTTETNSDPMNLQDGSSAKDCFTYPCGQLESIFPSLMRDKWRVFSRESAILLNCMLLRRSSYTSLEMRFWHLLSVSTWLDPGLLRDGITLGSLAVQNNRSLEGFSRHDSITINVMNREPAKGLDTDDDFADPANTRPTRPISFENCRALKVELFRHKLVVQCPWNALAVLLYYKWHVLKEPPPDFDDPRWMDQPLFGGRGSTGDEYLRSFCGELYSEFEASITNRQRVYKHIHNATYKHMAAAVSSSTMLNNVVSLNGTIFATKQFLQRNLYEATQILNSGFSSNSRSYTYHIERQHIHINTALKASVFPFADEIPDYDDLDLSNAEIIGRRDAAMRFCNTLKLLRTVLIQDMAVMFDILFYRQMLRGSVLLCSDTFQQSEFITISDRYRSRVWNSDIMALAANAPHSHILASIKCYVPASSSNNSPLLGKITEAADSETPKSQTLPQQAISLEKTCLGASPKAPIASEKSTSLELTENGSAGDSSIWNSNSNAYMGSTTSNACSTIPNIINGGTNSRIVNNQERDATHVKNKAATEPVSEQLHVPRATVHVNCAKGRRNEPLHCLKEELKENQERKRAREDSSATATSRSIALVSQDSPASNKQRKISHSNSGKTTDTYYKPQQQEQQQQDQDSPLKYKKHKKKKRHFNKHRSTNGTLANSHGKIRPAGTSNDNSMEMNGQFNAAALADFIDLTLSDSEEEANPNNIMAVRMGVASIEYGRDRICNGVRLIMNYLGINSSKQQNGTAKAVESTEQKAAFMAHLEHLVESSSWIVKYMHSLNPDMATSSAKDGEQNEASSDVDYSFPSLA
ncbi:hypothetical protein GGI26_000261 [Coemansia sp. RSA 1358]|nr:hypothetical protein GGI26_000261 [Coemansia sp. RSA 1358]